MKATIIFIASLIEIALCAWAAMLTDSIVLMAVFSQLGLGVFVAARYFQRPKLYPAVPVLNSIVWGIAFGYVKRYLPSDWRLLLSGMACVMLASLLIAVWNQVTRGKRLLFEIGVMVIGAATLATIALTIYSLIFGAVLLCLTPVYFWNCGDQMPRALALASLGLPIITLITVSACINPAVGAFILAAAHFILRWVYRAIRTSFNRR